MMLKTYKGTIFILIASLGLSTESIFAKLCYNTGINVSTVLFFRYGVSTVLLACFLIVIKEKFRIPLRSVKILAINIIIYIVFTFLLFITFNLLSPGLAIMLLYTFVAFTGILEIIINKVKLTKNKVITICLSLGGIAALSGASFNSVNRIGIITGITAALGYALYFIFMEKAVGTDLSEPVFMFNLFFFSSIVISGYSLISGELSFNFLPEGWIYLGFLSVFSTSVALMALTYGVALLGPTRSAIISTIEPPLTVLWAFLIFGDIFTPLQFLGALLVAGSILWNALSIGKSDQKQPERIAK